MKRTLMTAITGLAISLGLTATTQANAIGHTSMKAGCIGGCSLALDDYETSAKSLPLGVTLELVSDPTTFSAPHGATASYNGEFSVVLPDTTRPTVTFEGTPETVSEGKTFFITVTFSEPVSDLGNSGIKVSHGTLRGISFRSPRAGLVTAARLQITATGTKVPVIRIPENAVLDGAGNGNIAASSAAATLSRDQRKQTRTSAPHTRRVGSASAFRVSAMCAAS